MSAPSYRGWEIIEVVGGFIAIDGTDELPIADSIEECEELIDEWLEDNSQFGVGA